MAKKRPRVIQVLNRDGLGEEVFDSLFFRLAHQVKGNPEMREIGGIPEYEADMIENHLQGMGFSLSGISRHESRGKH